MTNSTKYVRKELRELIKQNSKYKITVPSYAEEIIKNAKRGGNTHCVIPDEFPECIDARDKTLCLYDYAGLILKAKEINIHG